jgi:hypothetical protein
MKIYVHLEAEDDSMGHTERMVFDEAKVRPPLDPKSICSLFVASACGHGKLVTGHLTDSLGWPGRRVFRLRPRHARGRI